MHCVSDLDPVPCFFLTVVLSNKHLLAETKGQGFHSVLLCREGHATMIHEIAASLPRKPSAIVLSVGGGGLFCGVLCGLHHVGWNDVPVVAMETEGANSLSAAVEAGHLVTIPAITRYCNLCEIYF